MPKILRTGFSLVDPNLSIADALGRITDDRQMLVVPAPGEKYACFLRADLESLAQKLFSKGVKPREIPLGRLARKFAVPGAPPGISSADFRDRLRDSNPLYGMIAAVDADGSVVGLLALTSQPGEREGVNMEIVRALANDLGVQLYQSSAKPPGGSPFDQPGTVVQLPNTDDLNLPFDPTFERGLPEAEPPEMAQPGEAPLPMAPAEPDLPEDGARGLEPAAGDLPAAEGQPAAEEQPGEETRFVQAQLFRLDGRAPVKLTQAFAAGQPHLLDLWIGKQIADTLVDKKASFPTSKLPPGRKQYALTISLTEPNHFQKPLISTLVLPEGSGESSHCHLLFTTSSERRVFSGRLVISFENRVLQTLLLEGRVLDDQSSPAADEKLSLTVEADLSGGVSSVEGVKGVDVCILQEGDTLYFLGDGTLPYVSIGGLQDHASLLMKKLADVSQNPERYTSLDSKNAVELLRSIAMHGYALYQAIADEQTGLPPDHPFLKPETSRIQLLSVKDGVFPLEAVYVFSGVLAEDAKPCPNAMEALRAGTCTHCAGLDEEEAGNFICPLRFIGLSKVIERRKIRGDQMQALKDSKVYNPVPGDDTIAPLRSVNYGYSAKVKTEDIASLQNALQSRAKASLLSTDWKSWPDDVKKSDPALLLIISHSVEKDAFINLQISSASNLPVIGITDAYVHGQTATHPIVLLLGCSTAVPALPFEGPAPRFYSKGAALTVTTIIPVLGQHVVPIAILLLDALQNAAEKGQSFGEALLWAKQQAMAGGYLTAMALVADGHIDWKITQ